MLKLKEYFKNYRRSLLVLVLPLVLTGCVFGIQTSSKQPATSQGGVFRSEDFGASWVQATDIYSVGGEIANFKTASITAMAFDAQDERSIYVGTQTAGLYYSYNYGNAWANALKGKGVVNDVEIDPTDSCTVFVAIHNTIYKSKDCSRHWDPVYFETLKNIFITAIAVNAENNRVVYAATSGGSLLKSLDFGRSWDVVRRFDTSIKDILVMNHTDSNIIYVVTNTQGVYKSSDAALNWSDLSELEVDQAEVDEEEFSTLKELGSKAKAVLSVAKDMSVDDGIILVNKIGIFRLTDSKMWKHIKLLTPKGKETIQSVAINQKNTNDLFYGTSQALYHSIDNGRNWAISKLPTANSAKILSFSPDTRFLFMGTFLNKAK